VDGRIKRERRRGLKATAHTDWGGGGNEGGEGRYPFGDVCVWVRSSKWVCSKDVASEVMIPDGDLEVGSCNNG